MLKTIFTVTFKMAFKAALLTFCFGVGSTLLPAAETIANTESIIIYDDGLLANLSKSIGKDMKQRFKKHKIKWSVKSLKQGTFATALESIEKDVLKKKPDIVALSFGLYDIYNPRKEELLACDLDSIEEHITKLVTLIHASKARVILISPGLCTEEIDGEEIAAATALTERIMAVAKKLGLTACDLHTPAVNWLKLNPPKKKGRKQLSKDGIKWNAVGLKLITSAFLRSFGMSSGNDINRPIQWNEHIVLHMPMNHIPFSFNMGEMHYHLTRALKTAGPQVAPADFTGPAIKGPDCIHTIYDPYPALYDVNSLKKHKPSVAFVYPLYHYATRDSVKDSSKLDKFLDEMMLAYSQLPFPVYVMTHLWGVENGDKTLSKGPRYERCKQVSDLIKLYAGKHNVAVIDLFAICEQINSTNKIARFGSEMHGNSSGNVHPSLAGKQLMFKEIKRALGVLKEDDK